jgi:CDP-4-dehydro-6-deoxyglucose reductase
VISTNTTGWAASRRSAPDSSIGHEVALADLGDDLSRYDVYASGPPAMVEAIRRTFIERGLPRAQLFFDSFDYAPDTLAAMRQRTGP